jgi:hypothetical protein
MYCKMLCTFAVCSFLPSRLVFTSWMTPSVFSPVETNSSQLISAVFSGPRRSGFSRILRVRVWISAGPKAWRTGAAISPPDDGSRVGNEAGRRVGVVRIDGAGEEEASDAGVAAAEADGGCGVVARDRDGDRLPDPNLNFGTLSLLKKDLPFPSV